MNSAWLDECSDYPKWRIHVESRTETAAELPGDGAMEDGKAAGLPDGATGGQVFGGGEELATISADPVIPD